MPCAVVNNGSPRSRRWWVSPPDPTSNRPGSVDPDERRGAAFLVEVFAESLVAGRAARRWLASGFGGMAGPLRRWMGVIHTQSVTVQTVEVSPE